MRSFFFVTTIDPFTQATSVTTSISVHGPAHEELDDVPLILDELSEDVELDDDSEEDDEVELGVDELLEVELLDDELLLELDDELVRDEVLDEVLLELGEDVLLLLVLLLLLLELELLDEPVGGLIHHRRSSPPGCRSMTT